MDYLAALARWQELKTAISHMQQEERALREGLFHGTFPDPIEGTNRYVLPDGRTVVGTFKLNRRVLEDELPKVLKKLKMKKSDAPVKTKVELVLSAYRELSDGIDPRGLFPAYRAHELRRAGFG